MSHITVQPGPGRRVPVEGRPHTYFEADKPVQVRSTRYIARRIADSDLIEVEAEGTV